MVVVVVVVVGNEVVKVLMTPLSELVAHGSSKSTTSAVTDSLMRWTIHRPTTPETIFDYFLLLESWFC